MSVEIIFSTLIFFRGNKMTEHIFKKQNAIYFIGIHLANMLFYYVIAYLFIRTVCPELEIGHFVGSMCLQILGWSYFKMKELKTREDQGLSSRVFIKSSLLIAVILSGLRIALNLSNPIEFFFLLIGHIFCQHWLWLESDHGSCRQLRAVKLRMALLLVALVVHRMIGVHMTMEFILLVVIATLYVVMNVIFCGCGQKHQALIDILWHKSANTRGISLQHYDYSLIEMRDLYKEGLKQMGVYITSVVCAGFCFYGLMFFTWFRQIIDMLGNLLKVLLELAFTIPLMIIFKIIEIWGTFVSKGVKGEVPVAALKTVKKGKELMELERQQDVYEVKVFLVSIFTLFIVVIVGLILFRILKKPVYAATRRIQCQMRGVINGMRLGEFSVSNDSKRVFRQPKNPFRKQYIKLILSLKKMGMIVSITDTPRELESKMIHWLPKFETELLHVRETYEALRYSREMDICEGREYISGLQSVKRINGYLQRQAIKANLNKLSEYVDFKHEKRQAVDKYYQ